MLKGTLLSHNSGCQVSERRLWDGASFSPGLLNWLCYCRPVQGEGREGESELWCVRYRAFDCDPPPRGRVFTAALSGEGDLALDPSLCFSLRTHPPHTHPFSAAPVVRSLPLRGHFVHHHGALSSPPLFLCTHRFLAQRESLILSALQISSLFFSVGCQHLSNASLWHHHPTHRHTRARTHTHIHIRYYSPHWLDSTLSGLLAVRKQGCRTCQS